MATCIRCRRDPCRCPPVPGHTADPAPEAEPADPQELADLADLARLARIRTEARSLSAAYVLWVESGRTGPEPLVPADVRKRIRELMAEAERLGR